jgi:hypothetical protein
MVRGNVHTKFWWGNLSERDYLENMGIVGRIILKLFLRKSDWVWIGLIWLRIRNSDGLLGMR